MRSIVSILLLCAAVSTAAPIRTGDACGEFPHELTVGKQSSPSGSVKPIKHSKPHSPHQPYQSPRPLVPSRPASSLKPYLPSTSPMASQPPRPSQSPKPTSPSKPSQNPQPSQTTTPQNTGGIKGLWQPAVGSSWQIVLSEKLNPSGALDPDVEVFDLDMFGNDAATIKELHDKGKKVICYFSAGSYEPYREDSNQFTANDLGAVMDGWPDEKWLDIRSSNVRNIMKKRIELAASKGCDAIDPDNVDGYSNHNGCGLTESDAFDFVKFLAETAAGHGMSTGLKNSATLVPKVIDFTHFVVNEECHKFSECGTFQPFIKKNKPVFNIEYPEDEKPAGSSSRVDTTDMCSGTTVGGDAAGFSTIIKSLSLDGWVQFCDSTVANTATAG